MGIKFSNVDLALGDISKTIAKGAYAGMTEVANVVEREAKTLAPVDDGLLRQSIGNKVEWEGPTTIRASVGTNLHYAPYVHQGTGIYAVDGDGRKEVPWHYRDRQGNWHTTKGQKPNPFINNAIERKKADIVSIVGGAIG